MKLDRQKYELARARACMGQKDLVAAGIPKGTLCGIINGRVEARPETLEELQRHSVLMFWKSLKLKIKKYACQRVKMIERS